MKKFQFRLKKILEIRTYEEKQEQVKFAKVLQVYVEIEERIKLNKQKQKEYILNQNQFTLSNDMNYFALRDQAMIGLQTRIKKDTREMIEQAARLEKAREVLLEKKKKRMALEKLYERKWHEYMVEFYKEENKVLDEIGTQRYLQNRPKSIFNFIQ